MIDYRAGIWGFHVALGWEGSLAPRALVMAIPNALLTLIVSLWGQPSQYEFPNEDLSKAAGYVITAYTSVMIFILYNRSRTSYNRWWEGGTLIQKTRGEWFNAYSSIMAFTSTKPEMQDQVLQYQHLLVRLMSLLMCCGLQQVSPNRDRPFEIIDLHGIDPASMEFLNHAPDKVEIILQWIQRSLVVHAGTGVIPVAPPILSRAFQEVSRGIVNLQNARKIADFPYPFPLAQVSMMLQLLHWAMTPIAASLALPVGWAVIFSFVSIFTLWCIHFNALDLEFPFGARVNDLPMNEFQQDWNKSITTLLNRKAACHPNFDYQSQYHDQLTIVMSDASELYVPDGDSAMTRHRQTVSVIKVGETVTEPGKEPPVFAAALSYVAPVTAAAPNPLAAPAATPPIVVAPPAPPPVPAAAVAPASAQPILSAAPAPAPAPLAAPVDRPPMLSPIAEVPGTSPKSPDIPREPVAQTLGSQSTSVPFPPARPDPGRPSGDAPGPSNDLLAPKPIARGPESGQPGSTVTDLDGRPGTLITGSDGAATASGLPPFSPANRNPIGLPPEHRARSSSPTPAQSSIDSGKGPQPPAAARYQSPSPPTQAQSSQNSSGVSGGTSPQNLAPLPPPMPSASASSEQPGQPGASLPPAPGNVDEHDSVNVSAIFSKMMNVKPTMYAVSETRTRNL